MKPHKRSGLIWMFSFFLSGTPNNPIVSYHITLIFFDLLTKEYPIGGDKATQNEDINKAQKLCKELKNDRNNHI